MEKRAETYINHVLKQEGYYVFDPNDAFNQYNAI